MVKKILIITTVLMLGLSGMSFAATGAQVLSDKALDGVNAGDWVILNDGQGNETTADVYTNNNTLWLLANSQKDIKAISNANVIDSAVAVQTNVARVSGDTPTENVAVTGANVADITNYRPASSHSSSMSKSDLDVETIAKSESEQFNATETFNLAKSESEAYSSTSGSTKNLVYDENLDADSALSSNSRDIQKGGIGGENVAAVSTLDYNKDILYVENSQSGKTKSEAESLTIDAVKTIGKTEIESFEKTESSLETFEMSCTSRDSKGANNHILLDETSQQSIQAISNLNSVASGAAVQTNVASNVGVSGSISHSNNATVQSGF